MLVAKVDAFIYNMPLHESMKSG